MTALDTRVVVETALGIPQRFGFVRGPLHGWGEPDMTMHEVYVHLAADETVLYVGCSKRLDDRTAEHRRHSAWWPFVARVMVVGAWPRHIALGVEKGLIAHYDPPGNYVGTPAWRRDMGERYRDRERPNRRALAKPLATPSA